MRLGRVQSSFHQCRVKLSLNRPISRTVVESEADISSPEVATEGGSHLPTENMLNTLTGFQEETWAEFLLGLAQHSDEINRFFGRHEEAHWNTLTIGQMKEWYEWRRRQQPSLRVPQPSAYPERNLPRPKAKIDFLDSFFLVAARDHEELLAKSPELKYWPSYRYCYYCRALLPGSVTECDECGLNLSEQPVLYPRRGMALPAKGVGQSWPTRKWD